jgi:hypothetical protein
LLAPGVNPDVALAKIRSKREENKGSIAGGIGTNVATKEEKLAREASVRNTFLEMACKWHAIKLYKWCEGYASDNMKSFNKDVFPYIGKKPIVDIKPFELLMYFVAWKQGREWQG